MSDDNSSINDLLSQLQGSVDVANTEKNAATLPVLKFVAKN